MVPPSSPPRIAVLGGGLTGLTAAWELRRAGFAPVVFERASRAGGAIGAWRDDGWLHELGPNSLLETPEVATFVADLGLAERKRYAAPEARRRYICRDGKLVAMPTSPLAFATTRLFSLRAKLGLLLEPWRPRRADDEDESVADFVVRRLGREFLDYAVNPFVGGVYAGDPRRLAVRHAFPKLDALERKYGSLLRGALALRNTSGGPANRMFSFPDGLAETIRALMAQLAGSVRLDTRIDRIRRLADGWELELESAGTHRTEKFAAVISAVPADALARLPFANVPGAERLNQLQAIEQPPVASVFVGYRRADVKHPLDGFGFLVPEVEQHLVLGALFSSTLFAGRAPEGNVALTAFVGGARCPSRFEHSDDEILGFVQADLSRLAGVRAAPVVTHVQRWPRAIPQYTLGYQRFKDAIAAFEANAPGCFIGGNARDGISLANCIGSGRRLARATARYLDADVTGREPRHTFQLCSVRM